VERCLPAAAGRGRGGQGEDRGANPSFVNALCRLPDELVSLRCDGGTYLFRTKVPVVFLARFRQPNAATGVAMRKRGSENDRSRPRGRGARFPLVPAVDLGYFPCWISSTS